MAVNTGENDGDMLALPRLIAADVVATDNPSPKKIVDVGSFTGEFLEAFMDKFPGARGQWTEPVDSNKVNAKRRFARFGDRLDYVIGCPHRDLSDGCVPKDVDVLITSWVTRHQELPGIRKVYKDAYPLLPSGGWFAILDQVTVPDHWEKQFQVARLNFMAAQEGPPEYQKAPIPTLDEQLAALHDAGFTDVQVVWKEFTTVLIMARKK
jgi:tRNA (cmo5U34)-methyltransferase